MKQDNFEKLLSQKLGDQRVTPPDGMWQRISANLQASENTAGSDASPRTVPLRRLTLRGRIAVWSTSAAAAVGTALLLFNINTNVVRMVADHQTGQAVDPQTREVQYPATGNPEDRTSPLENISATIYQRLAGPNTQQATYSTISRADSAMDSGLYDDDSGPGENNAEKETASNDPGKEIAAIEAGPDTIDNIDTAVKENKDGRELTSDMKGRGVSAMERAFAEELLRSRRTNPRITATVYAANSGSSSSTSNTQGNVNSKLVINEVNQTLSSVTGSYSYSNVTQKLKHRMPLTFGLSLNIGIAEKLSIGTGFTYSYLYSESEGSNTDVNTRVYHLQQKLHYIGIPVTLKYDFFTAGRFGFYASAGAAAEKAVSAKQSLFFTVNGEKGDKSFNELSKGGLHVSAMGNIGAEFKANDLVGIYIEPGVNYYFKNNSQPESYRTEHPFNFSLKAGLRFTF